MPVPDPWVLPARQYDHPTRGVLPDATVHARRELTFLALAALLLVSAVLLPLAGATVDLGALDVELPFAMVLPLGVLAFPLGLVAVNIACELFGRRRAGALVLAGMIAMGVALGVVAAGDALAGTANFGLALALAASFVIAHLANWLLFDALRRRMTGHHLWLRKTVATLLAQTGSWAAFAFVLYAYAIGNGMADADAAALVTAIAGGACAYAVVFALVELVPGVVIARALATYTRTGLFIDAVRAPRPAVVSTPRPVVPVVSASVPVVVQRPVPTRAERRAARDSVHGFSSMEMRFFTEGDTLASAADSSNKLVPQS